MDQDLLARSKYTERGVSEEFLSEVILFCERLLGAERLRRAYAERNHQAGNALLFPQATDRHREGLVRCRGPT